MRSPGGSVPREALGRITGRGLGSPIRRGRTLCLAVLLAVAFGPCGDVAAPEETEIGPTEVWIEDYGFLPLHQYVTPGTTVTWINRDDVPHRVVSGTPDDPEGWFESPVIDPGETFEHHFEGEGRYRYHCALHTGRIRTLSDMPVLFVRPQDQPVPGSS